MKNIHSHLIKILLIVCSPLLLLACEQTDDFMHVDIPVNDSTQINVSSAITTTSKEIVEVPDNLDFDLDNSRYVFDITKHDSEDLEILLNRVEEIHLNEREKYEGLDLVFILHGPDVHLFTDNNYQENKPLVDLAARLDAFGMIDMKICETYMSNFKINRNEVPPFIESIPFAPSEIKRLTDIGYINL